MPREFQMLPNPDNVPGLITTGYQRQNTNIFAIQTGIDTTEPYDNGAGIITIPAGGVIEINGSIFKLTANIILNKSVNTRAYWIAVKDNNDAVLDDNGIIISAATATAELVTRPGAWNNAKKGCYLTDGRRTLNWVSLGDISSTSGLTSVDSYTTKGSYTKRLKPGWYLIQLRSGSGGGNGGSGLVAGQGGAGGIATLYKSIDGIIFSNGKTNHKIFIGGNGGPGGRGGNGGVSVTSYGVAGNGGRGGNTSGGAGSNGASGRSSSAGSNIGGGGGGGGSGCGQSSSFDNLVTGDYPPGKGGDASGGGCNVPGAINSLAGRGGYEGSGGSGFGIGGAGGSGGIGESSGGAGGGGGGGGNSTTSGENSGKRGGDGTAAGNGGAGGDGAGAATSNDNAGSGGGGGGGGGKSGALVDDGTPGGLCLISSITN